jgi:hypothetical protein
MADLGRFSGKAWVAVGDQVNWERGLENGIWGLRPQLKNHWTRIEPGDLILFYCKMPVKGFVGAGIIRSKFRQTVPYWIQEIEKGDVIWPFRFEFDVTHLIPLTNDGGRPSVSKFLSILANGTGGCS